MPMTKIWKAANRIRQRVDGHPEVVVETVVDELADAEDGEQRCRAGRNTRNGLYDRVMRMTWSRYRRVSVHQWNFDSPARSEYSMGQYFTE